MINSTNINANSIREVKGKVELFNNDSTLRYVFLPEDNLQEITITRAGEHGKFFGFGIAQKAVIKVIDIAESLVINKDLALRVYFNSDGSDTYLKIGPKFFVKEITRDEKTKVITITAYDAIDNTASCTFAKLGLTAPYKISDVVSAAYTLLKLDGYSLSRTSYANGFETEYEKGANFFGNEILRTVLNAIAEVTQTVYFINNDNALEFRSLKIQTDPALTISKDDYFDLLTGNPATITKIVHTTELGDNLEVGTDDGAVQYIRDNQFWENRTDLATLIPEALNRISGLTIIPYNIKWRGSYLTEIGDKISIETKDGSFIETYILDDAFSYNGSFSQDMTWKYDPDSDRETEANPITIGEKINQTFARVDKIEKKITLQVSEVVNEIVPGKIDEALEEALGAGLESMVEDINNLKATTSTNAQNISQLTVTSNGINQEVSSLKESTTTISNELDEVIATQNSIQEDVSSLQVNTSGISASVTSVEQKVTKVENDINNVASQTNERIDKVSSEVALKLDREAVEIEVNKRIEEGVDKVVTSSKKYTFDDTGLNISAPDSEFSTEVTDNGMRIYKHSSEVLTVDNQGVKAQDLHAYTFLIIGENSRMEDRGNRTACFWIGPAGG